MMTHLINHPWGKEKAIPSAPQKEHMVPGTQGSVGKSNWLQAGSCRVRCAAPSAPGPSQGCSSSGFPGQAFPWQSHLGDTHLLPCPLPWQPPAGLSLPHICSSPAVPLGSKRWSIGHCEAGELCLLRFSHFPSPRTCLATSVTLIKLLLTAKMDYSYWK